MVLVEFLFVGFVILTGFASRLFFEKTKIPDAVPVILLGIALGPALGWLDPYLFIYIAPFLASLCLGLVLFDAGLALDSQKIFRELLGIAGFSLLAFLITVFLSVIGLVYIFQFNPLHAILIGIILSCGSSSIVYGLLKILKISGTPADYLGFESVLSDVFTVVSALAVLSLIKLGSGDLFSGLGLVAVGFAYAALLGLLCGLCWIFISKFFENKPMAFAVTFAVFMLLYAVADSFSGSGAFAVLFFGLVLGNAPRVRKLFKLGTGFSFRGSGVANVRAEIAFFVRAFFLLFLGLTFSFSASLPTLAAISLLLVACTVIARYIATKSLSAFVPGVKKLEFLFISLFPKGLVAALLTITPLTQGILVPFLSEIALLVILASNIVSAFAAEFFQRASAFKR